jgi:prevent-host-death family protein
MYSKKVSVAQAKKTLSSLINKVAYGKTRVVLESRGKPKAALVSTEDLARLEDLERRGVATRNRPHILEQAAALRRKIQKRRKKTLSYSAERLNRLREGWDHGF